ncbi:MAG: hypothetical protein GY915_01875 [bacterium]|nr:hypothetical protein [bacterium]
MNIRRVLYFCVFCIFVFSGAQGTPGDFKEPFLGPSTPSILNERVVFESFENWRDRNVPPAIVEDLYLPDCLTSAEKEFFLRRVKEGREENVSENAPLLLEDPLPLQPVVIGKGDFIRALTPILEKIKEDIAPGKVARKRWFVKNGTMLATLISCVYLRSLFFANDGAIDDWFGIETTKQATMVGIASAFLYALPEWLEIRENWDSLTEYWSDKKGLVKQNSRNLRRLVDGAICVAASGKVVQMLKLYFDIGFQGGLDWVEFGLTMPFMIPHTLTRSVRGMREFSHDLWDRFSKGRSRGINLTRLKVLETLSNSYRKVKHLRKEELSDLADIFGNIRGKINSKEQNLLLILSLLNSLYHLDEEELYQSLPGKHPFGYRASKWTGHLVALAGAYPISAGCEFVMADNMGLVRGEDASSYTSNWTAGQNLAVYSFVTVAGGYVLTSAGRILERELSNLYCWISGYDPNARRKILGSSAFLVGRLNSKHLKSF